MLSGREAKYDSRTGTSGVAAKLSSRKVTLRTFLGGRLPFSHSASVRFMYLRNGNSGVEIRPSYLLHLRHSVILDGKGEKRRN